MKKMFILLCTFSLLACTHTPKEYNTDMQVINLWPDGPAEDNGLEDQNPILTVYPAARPNGTAIVVCPGGAYSRVCYTYEGNDLAPWLNGNGITLAVLRYRLPNGHSSVPLADGLRAMEIMREKADELGIQRLGIMGFSAGGHLASTIATHYTSEVNKPDFQVLIYPVISMDSTITHAETRHNLIGNEPTDELVTLYSNELQINTETPAAFIALSGDDEIVPIANSLRYYQALQRATVPAELHMYPTGGHGWGYYETDFRDLWTSAMLDWLLHDELNCFAVIAGKQTTTDGSVLMGHNEDDSGEQMLNMYAVPADEQAGTCKYLWAEFPGMTVCDSYMNEHGVCIASDGCPSCEDRDDFTDGGVLYEVRQEVAKHATSARHAVHLIGELVEKKGYRGSGRTYVIADPDEGWICSVVKGRHWVAQRVPDDRVMCIPNYYTITQVNLEDTLNFLGCRDIESYAIERGWYDPQRDGAFNFRLAYHAPSTFTRESNAWRHEAVIDYITQGQYNYTIEGVGPMFTPAHKINVQDIINMLSVHRDRGENVHPYNVCTNVTILSSVFQLRSWLPREIGCVMWNCPSRPCSEVFVPWYLGMEQTPAEWHRFATAQEAEQKHFTDTQDKRLHYPDAACWHYVDRWNKITANYQQQSEKRTRVKAKVQQQLFEQETQMTERLQHMPAEERAKAQLAFTRRCLKLSRK